MHGADGIGTELMAQRLDVAVDGAGAGCVDPVPDLFEQLFAGEHRLRAAGQRGQQIELGGGQMHLFAVHGDDALGRVYDHRTEVEQLLVLRVLGDDLRTLHAAQQRLAAGDKLAHGERLGHVIIGTRSQTDDLVGLVITCGEDQHRHRTFGDDAFGGL